MNKSNYLQDDPLSIDVSVLGSPLRMPENIWPSEQEVSFESVLRGALLLKQLREAEYKRLGL